MVTGWEAEHKRPRSAMKVKRHSLSSWWPPLCVLFLLRGGKPVIPPREMKRPPDQVSSESKQTSLCRLMNKTRENQRVTLQHAYGTFNHFMREIHAPCVDACCHELEIGGRLRVVDFLFAPPPSTKCAAWKLKRAGF